MPRFEIAGVPGGRASLFNLFKSIYLKRMPDAINEEQTMLGIMNKSAGSVIGGQIALRAVMHRHLQSSGMYIFENADLPDPTTPAYAQLELWGVTAAGRIRVTAQAKSAARAGDKASYGKPVAEMMKSARKNYGIKRNRAAWLGPLHIIGELSTYTHGGSGVMTLIPRNSRNYAANSRWASGNKYLYEQEEVSFIAASGGNAVPLGNPTDDQDTTGNRRVILSIVDDTSITITTSGGSAGANPPSNFAANSANALLIPFGSRRTTIDNSNADDSNFDSQLATGNGVLNLFVSATEKAFVYHADRATNPFLNGTVLHNSGTLQAFNEDMLDLGISRSQENRFNTGECDRLVTGRAERREYVKEAKGDRRFEAIQTKKGYTRLVYTAADVTLPVFVDRHCPDHMIACIDSTNVNWYEEQPLTTDDDPKRFVANKLAEEWTFYEIGNFAAENHTGNSIHDDINSSASALIA